MADTRPRTGSVSAHEDGTNRKKVGWLWWLLLLAGLIALGIFLLLRNNDDAGDDPGLDVTDEQAANGAEDSDAGEVGDNGTGSEDDGTTGTTADDGTTGTTADGSTGTTAASSGGAGDAGDSPLTSGETALLPVPAAGLGAYSGDPATARTVTVESVVTDEGFWVGTSPTDRVFVFFAAENSGTESAVQVTQGATVSFEGVIKPLPPDPGTAFELTEVDGLAQLQAQGQYIEIAPDAIRQG